MEHNLLIIKTCVDGFCACLTMSDIQSTPKPEEKKKGEALREELRGREKKRSKRIIKEKVRKTKKKRQGEG